MDKRINSTNAVRKELELLKTHKGTSIVADVILDSDYYTEDINLIFLDNDDFEKNIYQKIDYQCLWAEYVSFGRLQGILDSIKKEKEYLDDFRIFCTLKSGLRIKDKNNFLKNTLTEYRKSNFKYTKSIYDSFLRSINDLYDMAAEIFQNDIKSSYLCARHSVESMLIAYFLNNNINILSEEIDPRVNWYRDEIKKKTPEMLQSFDKINFKTDSNEYLDLFNETKESIEKLIAKTDLNIKL